MHEYTHRHTQTLSVFLIKLVMHICTHAQYINAYAQLVLFKCKMHDTTSNLKKITQKSLSLEI